MPSRSNPNVPAKAKRLAHPRKAKSSKITKARHTKTQSKNVHVGGQISNKKARKLEKKQNFARRRALEKSMKEAGEVEMTDAPKVTPRKDPGPAARDAMEVDEVS